MDIYTTLRDSLNFNVMYIKVYKHAFVKITVDLIFNYSRGFRSSFLLFYRTLSKHEAENTTHERHAKFFLYINTPRERVSNENLAWIWQPWGLS